MGTTAAQKKLFFNLRKIKGQLEAIDDGDLSPENVEYIAAALNVPERDVISMNGRMLGPDQSLNAPVREEGGGEWQDWLEDPETDQESLVLESDELAHRSTQLVRAMNVLNEREKHILSERRLKEEPATLEQLSKVYGISRERVRQIEARAFEKLQKTMHASAQQERDNERSAVANMA
jgi:RNA polymerase sigma-32 factor